MARDVVILRLTHEPFGYRSTTLVIRVRRYTCSMVRAGMATGHHFRCGTAGENFSARAGAGPERVGD